MNGAERMCTTDGSGCVTDRIDVGVRVRVWMWMRGVRVVVMVMVMVVMVRVILPSLNAMTVSRMLAPVVMMLMRVDMAMSVHL